ncbi:MAG: hypothetical protein BWX64_00284 [Acidobacteria bacterium ADurb.Bin051]|nr:MAG: hypothetical protein BWX64_00284 [Acidobacteria bacterium ADurb.Bin051]
MKTNVQIGLEVRGADVAQAVESFRKVGVPADEAARKVEALVSAAKTGGDKIAAAMLEAAAQTNRYAEAAERGSSRAATAGAQAVFKIQELAEAIRDARAAGAPVDEEAVATLRKLEAASEDAARKVARFREAQDDVADATRSAKAQTDLQRSSVGDLGDIAEMISPKLAKMVGMGSALSGGFIAGYAATRKLIEGLHELLGVDVDGWVQRQLSGFADWVVGYDANAGAADRLRNAQNVLKNRGIDPTGKSLEELDRLLEDNSRALADLRAKTEEAAEAAAEAWKKRLEAVRSWADAELAAFNSITAGHAAFERSLENLTVAIRAGYVTTEEALRLLGKYEAAWTGATAPRALLETPELDPEPFREIGQIVADSAIVLEGVEDSILGTNEAQAEGVALARDWRAELEGWLGAIYLAGDALAGFNADLGRGVMQAARLTAQILEAYKVWKAAGSQRGFTSEGVMGGLSTGSQIGGMGQSFGWWQGDRGTGSLGGGLSGDFGDTGATIGGAIGSYFGPVGQIVGSLIGGVLGGAIKRGADEGLGELRQTINGIATYIGKSEGGLGSIVAQIGDGISDAVMGILDAIGGSLESMPAVSIKVRDDVITVVVGAVRQKFRDVDEAVAFATREILKQSEVSGLSETVAAVLQRTFGDLEELGAALDFAAWYDALGLDEAGVAFKTAMRDFGVAVREAVALGLDLGPIQAELGRSLGALRNQILGISESEDERIRRQAAAFNAELVLVRAQQETRLADLKLQEAELRVKAEILRAEAGIGEAERDLAIARTNVRRTAFETDVAIFEGEAALLQGKQSLLGATLAQLAAVADAIAAAEGILGALPDLISPEEIAAAIGRVGSGGGGWGGGGGVDTGPTLEDFERSLEGLARELLPAAARALADLRDRFEELRAEAVALGAPTEELEALWGAMLERLQSDTRAPWLAILEGDGPEAQIQRIWRAMVEGLEAYAELGLDGSEVLAAATEQIAALRDSVLSSIAPSYALRQRYDELAESLEFLRANADALGISTDELGAIMAEAGSYLFLDMAERLARAIGDEETLGALAALRWELELANYELEIERLAALGVLTEEQLELLYELLGRARDFDFSAGGGGGGYDPRAAAAAEAARRQQEAARLQEENARRMAAAIERLVDFQRSLLLSDLSPLTPQQRLEEAQSAAQSLVQQILAMPRTDPARAGLLEQLPDVLRQYLAELGAVWGTSSGAYAAGFAWVQQILAALGAGGNVLPGPGLGTAPGGGANTGGGWSGGNNLPPGWTPRSTSPLGGNVLPFTAPGRGSDGAGRELAEHLSASNALLERSVRLLEQIEQKTADSYAAELRSAMGARR